jgi:hypothetical protein
MWQTAIRTQVSLALILQQVPHWSQVFTCSSDSLCLEEAALSFQGSTPSLFSLTSQQVCHSISFLPMLRTRKRTVAFSLLLMDNREICRSTWSFWNSVMWNGCISAGWLFLGAKKHYSVLVGAFPLCGVLCEGLRKWNSK